MTLWAELKRRRVVRVAVAYVAAAIGVGGAAELFLPNLGAPSWVVPTVMALLVLGFPAALILSWAYDITPEGIKRDAGPAVHAPDTPAAIDASAEAPSGGSTTPTVDSKAIAVLPFVNLSDDPENEYFADGVAEDILTRLSQIGELHVVSRTSVTRYKGTDKSIAEIASELRVGTILEGSVRRAGDRVRVVAQLIEASTDRHLWAETYDRDLSDIFAVQAGIAENIASALHAQLAPDQVARVRHSSTENVEAYELFLRGRALIYRMRPQDVERGVELVEEATSLDPGFANAFATLAAAKFINAYYGTPDPGEALRAALSYSDDALSSDPDLASAWAARGCAKSHLWDWEGGEADLVRAIELDPNDYDARFYHGHMLNHLARFEEAEQSFAKAASLAPSEPMPRQHRANSLMMLGRPGEAIDLAEQAVDLDPALFEPPIILGWVLAGEGRLDEAIEQLTTGTQLSGGMPWPKGFLTLTLHLAGYAAEASRLAAELRADSAEEGPLGLVFASLVDGAVEEAMRNVEALADVYSPMVPWLWMAPWYSVLFEEHPRFLALQDRVYGGARRG